MAVVQYILLLSMLSCMSFTWSRLLGARASPADQTLDRSRSILLQADRPKSENPSNSTLKVLPPVPLRSSRLEKMVNFFESTTNQDTCYRKDPQMFRFYCPSPEPIANGGERYICIRKEQLCDHIPDCPAAEDEDMHICMFYQAIQYELHTLKSLMSTHLSDRISSRSVPSQSHHLPDF